MSKKIDNPKGFRNGQSKSRNAARKQFRQDHPEHRGKQLKKWPIESNSGVVLDTGVA